MNDGKVHWGGNMPAIVTPFTREGEIDDAKFVQVIELLVSEGATGVVVSGSNGESWSLSPGERIRLFRRAKEVLGRRAIVIGGTGTIITSTVIEMTMMARETGIDGVMIMPPYYCQATRREVVAHFRLISDAVPIPILVYNSPKAVGFDVTGDVAAELAEIEWVAGIKQGSVDFMTLQHTVAAVGARLRVLSGHSAKRGLAAVTIGAHGFVSSLDTNVMGREGISLFTLAAAGEYESARRVQTRTLALDTALGGLTSGPAVMKAAMNLLGRPGGYPRRPLLPATNEQIECIRKALDALGLFSQARHAV